MPNQELKGKKTFTKAEETCIRQVLRILEEHRTKANRDKLRNLGFYITDFTSSKKGFTESDFNDLIKNKDIKITD